MSKWFRKQLRKITAFIIALYLTIVTTKEREQLIQIGDVDDLEEAYGNTYKERK